MGAISGVGSKTERTLSAMGVELVSDLRSKCTKRTLIDVFGRKVGE